VIDSLPVCLHASGAPCEYDLMCIFCQDEYKEGDRVRSLPCKHAFHADCVDEWLRENSTCPMCKKPVVEDEDEETSEK